MTFSTSAKPLGAYTSRHDLICELEECYGSRFERMARHLKLIFRAALANYLAAKPYWVDTDSSDITCIQCCIEGAGVDAGIWDEENDDLTELIEECAELSDSDLEGLIEAMSAQLRDGRHEP